MSARPARRSGVRGIDVKVDYLFVYAVQKPGQPATVQRLVARLTGTWFLDPGSGGSFWLMEQGVSATPARCRPNDGFIRPTFPEYGGEDPDTEPSGTPIDPYDQSRPEETGTGCRRASRT